jgi:hypothetical protein
MFDDIFLKNLSSEEAEQFMEDLWECGIPPVSFEEWRAFYHKWKDRVELPDLNLENYNLFKK